jgi:hypothetical protein
MSRKRKNAGWTANLTSTKGVASDVLRAVIACCRAELQRRKRVSI